jgi:quercetin dioxygenase-like cupin family protein
VTLWRGHGTSVVLFDFEAGGQLPGHHADGVVTIHALSGSLEVTTPSGPQPLAAGELLLLTPEVRHDVHALQPSRMLLTVHLIDD